MDRGRQLRNKKTGQIGDLIGSERSCHYITIGIDFHDGNPRSFDYTSLDQLNEEWEDYDPTAPLIKDEKKRKAFQAWLEACEIQKTAAIKYEGYGRFRKAFKLIDFDTSWNEPGIKPGSYTGVQLIGKEEE